MDKTQSKPKRIPDIQKILSFGQERSYSDGDILFKEGEDDPNFYIILSGEVEVSKKTSDGDSKVIAQVGEGDFIGEGVLFGMVNKSASAKAMTHTKALLISADKFEKLFEDEPSEAANFMLYIVELANNRLTKANSKLLALYEINQIMHIFRDDTGVLAKNLIEKLIVITDSKYGILLSKNPFSNTYSVIHSTLSDLNEKSFDGLDLGRTCITEYKNRKYMIIDLEGQGALVLVREADADEYEADELRFLMLISEQLASVIKEAFEKESEKAKKMLERKHFEV